MSVLIVTSLGDIVVDLHAEKCPLTCKNFLKLCKIKYYNGCLFHTIQKDFTAQTGDPTGTGTGGDSIYKYLYGDQARFFGDEIHLDLKHLKTGTVAMASGGENLNASQFYITLRDGLDYLDGKHTVFGEVAEGLETLTRINEAFVDEKSRPYKNIRIKHTYILDDPFEDPPQLSEYIPDASPEGKPKEEVDDDVRLEDDWVPLDEQLGPAELEEVLRAKDAHSSAVVLESIGDIPDAEVKPPEDVLFVCKLNPVTEDEDLHTIFSRFGTVLSAEIIRDYKTGDSLCYAFIEFETREACEQAYFKMDNALIDDRRIHVDFSQSVSKLWSQYRRKDKTGKGGGCFKCGETDHFAKDCTRDPILGQRAKYTLKEDNAQHGGCDGRYEMVFDGDDDGGPRPDNNADKHNGRGVSKDSKDRNSRYQEKDDRDRLGGRSQRHRDDDRGMDSKDRTYGCSERDLDCEERKERGSRVERRREHDSSKKDIRDGRKINRDDRPERRDNEDYRSKHIHEGGKYNDRDRIKEIREKRRKRSADDDDDGSRREDQDYKRCEENERRESRNDPSHKRRNADDERGRRHGHEDRRHDSERDRRHRGDRR